MKVIDERSGKELKIGDVASYPDGEWLRLIDFDAGLLSATAVIEVCERDEMKAGRPLVVHRRSAPLAVRFFHPKFFCQHVAFIPS